MTQEPRKSNILKYSLVALFAFALVASALAVNTQIRSDRITASQLYLGENQGFSSLTSSVPFITNSAQTLSVCSSGCDHTTIQSAINSIPMFIRHEQRIVIGNGNYDEDIVVPSFFVIGVTNQTEGSVQGLTITGNTTDRNLVTVGSIHIVGGTGSQTPTIQYMKLTRSDPYGDENSSISIYGRGHAIFRYMNFSGANAKYGIMAYGSSVTSTSNDFGIGTLETAYLVKHGGQIYNIDIPDSGSTTLYTCLMTAGNCFLKNNSIISPTRFHTSNQGTGLFLDQMVDNGTLWNVNKFGASILNLSVAQSEREPFKIRRTTDDLEKSELYTDDAGLVMNMTQDESTGGNLRIYAGTSTNTALLNILTTTGTSVFSVGGNSNIVSGSSAVDSNKTFYVGANGIFQIARASTQYMNHSSTAAANQIFAVGKNMVVGTADSNSFQIVTSGSTRVHVNQSGSVGIGTTNPGSTLHVVGELNVSGIAGDGAGKAVCIKSNGQLGTCGDAVGAGGTCTCA